MIEELKSLPQNHGGKLTVGSLLGFALLGWQLWIQHTVAQAALADATVQNVRAVSSEELSHARDIYVQYLVKQLSECSTHERDGT